MTELPNTPTKTPAERTQVQAWVGDAGTIVLTPSIELERYPTERFGIECVQVEPTAAFTDAVRRLQQDCTTAMQRAWNLEERLELLDD